MSERDKPARGKSQPSSASADNSKFDPLSLRLSQNFGAAAGVKKLLTVVQVRKPNRQEFVRVHPDPDYCLETAVLEFKEEGEVYLVSPALWDGLVGELIPKILYLTISRQGVVRLWPIRLPDENGKLDDYNRSALESAELAKRVWVRLSANRSAGMYETRTPTGELAEPEWPDLSFQAILEIAFRGKFIGDWDHAALKRLRGEG